ncbi:hypothetical protein BDV10DRAFT_171068 [Aspergillus recurvatus]
MTTNIVTVVVYSDYSYSLFFTGSIRPSLTSIKSLLSRFLSPVTIYFVVFPREALPLYGFSSVFLFITRILRHRSAERSELYPTGLNSNGINDIMTPSESDQVVRVANDCAQISYEASEYGRVITHQGHHPILFREQGYNATALMCGPDYSSDNRPGASSVYLLRQ